MAYRFESVLRRLRPQWTNNYDASTANPRKMDHVYSSVIVLVFFVTSALSQEQVIDVGAFNAGMRRSQRPVSEWQGKARRIYKTTEEEFSNLPGMDHIYKDVTEYDATGSRRFLWEAITGSRGRKGEVVSIGNVTFIRSSIEDWTRKEGSPPETRKPTLPFESDTAADPQSYLNWHEPG